MNKTLLFFKWIFLPYFITVFLAATIGKQKTEITFGNNLFEEYLIVMIFIILIDLQKIIIKWINK